jgi:hypothetical protein
MARLCAIGVIVVLVPVGRWQRVAVTALLVVPLVLIIGLSAPTWLAWPFLPERRHKAVLQFLRYLIDWIKAIVDQGDRRIDGVIERPKIRAVEQEEESPAVELYLR